MDESFSVLLSVYVDENALYLDRALHSVWSDQHLKPNQIVLIKDGALTAELDTVLSTWMQRLGVNVLTIVGLEQNIGLAAALNIGLMSCRYELVARMDTDDVALPDRFEKQVAFMMKHPHLAASSAQVEEWDENLTELLSIRALPCEHDQILKLARSRSPLSHPLVIFRKQAVLDVGGYPSLRKAQDYALWSLLLNEGYSLGNLSDVLLKMRTGSGLMKRRRWSYFMYEAELLRFQRQIGFLSAPVYYRNLLARGTLRILPTFAQRFAYRFAR